MFPRSSVRNFAMEKQMCLKFVLALAELSKTIELVYLLTFLSVSVRYGVMCFGSVIEHLQGHGYQSGKRVRERCESG